ncbi:DUF4124 domain-containing protein [Pseudoalteromonas tunicata]|jgi:hypothetical protein|uniref:DUF4124 domain-containing protein n=1 Tax=Pseudoalteromonas tunicata D2 TaxID=87626 RepID=A4C610_9GAMM|nr:DUF4124 domain-containing protein [Pseudoalteromonas tunicata]ATC95388.1 hypothetical protein PTUN_a2991 [Pseudoalteromonas tunicata]AXT30973.1 DUF4124 domain-containing protein [Pseudoalteromonas tunicata]EAR29414.1 hypothetical protein PTD2_11379 [Pseudoalteromonas tunicata D2]
MDIRFSVKYLGIVILLSSSLYVSAKTIRVYTWTDAKGIVHYSQIMPEHSSYQEFEIKEPVNLTLPTTEMLFDEAKPTLVEELDKRSEDYCEKSRHNLNVLENFGEITAIDESGQEKILSSADKLEHIELAQKRIKMFCEATL